MNQHQTGVLFDLDGTLLDTAPEFTFCLNQILHDVGKPPVTVAALREHVSFGIKGMLAFAFPEISDPAALTSHACTFRKLYDKHLGQHTGLFPGIPELLTWLTEQNIPWGIVTNKPKHFTQPLVAQFHELSKSGTLIAGDTLPVSKPDPAPLFAACAELNIQPGESWFLGDSLTDLKAGRNAGMQCVLVDYGYLPTQEDVRAWEADHYIPHPDAMRKILS